MSVTTIRPDAPTRSASHRATEPPPPISRQRQPGATPPWSAAAAETLVVLPPGRPVQRGIDRQLAAVGVRARRTVPVNALDTQIAMVEAGEGTAIIPSLGLPVCRNRHVVMSRLIKPAVTMDFHQIRVKGRRLSPAAEDFASFLEAYVSRWAGPAGVL